MDENMAFFMDKLKELVPFAKEREQELTSDRRANGEDL